MLKEEKRAVTKPCTKCAPSEALKQLFDTPQEMKPERTTVYSSKGHSKLGEKTHTQDIKITDSSNVTAMLINTLRLPVTQVGKQNPFARLAEGPRRKLRRAKPQPVMSFEKGTAGKSR
uniref:Uncharacterized protein n=1 Tax=Micrurus corallinus TaxID=54390 RepID=A0A2D4F8N9_MICCO